MWVKYVDFWKLQESLTAEVKRQLDLAGIGIPYPQMDIHLNRVDDAESQDLARPRMRPSRRESAAELRENRMPYAS